MRLNLNSIEGRNEISRMAELRRILADRHWLNCSLEECVDFYIQIRELRGEFA